MLKDSGRAHQDGDSIKLRYYYRGFLYEQKFTIDNELGLIKIEGPAIY